MNRHIDECLNLSTIRSNTALPAGNTTTPIATGSSDQLSGTNATADCRVEYTCRLDNSDKKPKTEAPSLGKGKKRSPTKLTRLASSSSKNKLSPQGALSSPAKDKKSHRLTLSPAKSRKRPSQSSLNTTTPEKNPAKKRTLDFFWKSN